MSSSPTAKASLIAPRPFTVKSVDGKEHRVSVKPLDVVDLYTFIECAAGNRSIALVELVTDRNADFVRQLEPADFGALAKECWEVNFPRAMGLVEDPVASATLLPMVKRYIGVGMTALSVGELSKSSVSERPSSGSAEETGAASSATPSGS